MKETEIPPGFSIAHGPDEVVLIIQHQDGPQMQHTVDPEKAREYAEELEKAADVAEKKSE